jgi:hypothetical protein
MTSVGMDAKVCKTCAQPSTCKLAATFCPYRDVDTLK